MIEAAEERNAKLVKEGRVDCLKASVEAIPFPGESFDRAVTVNCIHFWDIPKALSEIRRVMVPGGKLVVASNVPETMSRNPFAKPENGFRNVNLDRSSLEKLHKDARFSNVTVEDYTEDGKRVDGTPYVRRSFMTIAINSQSTPA